MAKKFVVTTIYQEQGGKATNALIGVFTDEEKAGIALENAFHKACNSLDIAELNGYSHYTECDSFHLCDGEDETYFYDGEIQEVEEDIEYDDESPYLISEDEKDDKCESNFQVVQSLAELIGKINDNIDNGEGPVEIIIKLNYGAFSRKTITFADELDECGDYKFELFNCIDETTQILSRDELFDDCKTYVGKAINTGNLFYVLD